MKRPCRVGRRTGGKFLISSFPFVAIRWCTKCCDLRCSPYSELHVSILLPSKLRPPLLPGAFRQSNLQKDSLQAVASVRALREARARMALFLILLQGFVTTLTAIS